MRNLNRAFVLLLALILCVCNGAVFVFASDNGVITVGDAEGYPGDIVAVPITISSLPANGFAAGTFVISFGDNLEYVNAVQCESNYGSITFTKPSEASAEKNSFNIVIFSGLADQNFNYTRQLATVYFRVRSDALSTDDASKNTVSVHTSDSINSDMLSSEFDCDAGVVTVLTRSSELGETIVGHSLTLDGAISLNFHVSVSEALLNNEDAFVRFEIDGNETEVISERLSNCRTDAGGNLILSCALPSLMWSRTVTATVSDGNGVFGESYSYSVKNYAMYMLSGNFTSGDDDRDLLLKDLCVALLNYGGYSQRYFNYFSGSELELANGNVVYGNNVLIKNLVSSQYDSDIRADSSAQLTDSCSGISYYGVNVAVDAATALTHYFMLDGDPSDYVFTVSASAIDDAVLEPFEFEGMIAVKIADVPAAYLDMPYTVTVSPAEGNAELSVTYSVRSYMAHNLDSAENGLPDLIRAMYLYSVAADAYFGR